MEFGDAGWNFDVEGEDIESIALPRDDFAAGFEFEAGNVGDGAFRAVLAGDPLWVIDGDRAWLDGMTSCTRRRCSGDWWHRR